VSIFRSKDRSWPAAVCLMIGIVIPSSSSTAMTGKEGGTTTNVRLSSGYDTYVHTYHLATDDTTETIGEFNAGADIEIRSAPRALHHWHLRAEMNLGSQLLRELLDLGYRWRTDGGDTRVRAGLSWSGRQFRQSSEYALSSDNQEARAELRVIPWRLSRRADLELRIRTRLLEYSRPSVLEQNQRDLQGAVSMTSRGGFHGAWSVGLHAMNRTYRDSTALNRRTYGVEGHLESSSQAGNLWIYHRSDRRRIADSQVRPSAWLHWSEMRLAAAAGGGHIVFNATSEVWRYERQTSVWFDAWRSDLEIGRRWGDLFSLQRDLLVTFQRLAADDSPEAHNQIGLRGSIESHASSLGGILALELGRRWYRRRGMDGASDPDGLDTLLQSYSDFTYIELWIMATWQLSSRMSMELTASYLPEHHTERTDNLVLGYGALRLVWRP
jgi:hypothetical protein